MCILKVHTNLITRNLLKTFIDFYPHVLNPVVKQTQANSTYIINTAWVYDLYLYRRNVIRRINGLFLNSTEGVCCAPAGLNPKSVLDALRMTFWVQLGSLAHFYQLHWDLEGHGEGLNTHSHSWMETATQDPVKSSIHNYLQDSSSVFRC
jgi:hypothetical protein